MANSTTYFVHKTREGFLEGLNSDHTPRWTAEIGPAHPFHDLALASAVAKLCGGPSCHVGVIATVPLVAGPVSPGRARDLGPGEPAGPNPGAS